MSEDLRPTAEAAVLSELEWVRRLARRLLQDATLADDVAQDAWLAAAQSPPEERDRAGGLRAWLSVVVKNRVRRLVRTDRRRRAREEAARRAMASEDPADVAARAALHHEVTAAVMALDEPFRSALLWRYLDELPATEIARRQGIGHDAARKRLSRGLQLLRERFERSHPGGFAAWCVAWTRALGPGAAAPLAAMSFLTVMLMNKWLLLVGGALGAALWFSWPTAPLAPPPDAQRTADAGATAAGSSPAAPAPRAAERTADNVAAGLVLTVVDGEQRPRADVHVFALARSELVARTTTGADGTARFAAALAADEWLLATAGTVPVRLRTRRLPPPSSSCSPPAPRCAGRCAAWCPRASRCDSNTTPPRRCSPTSGRRPWRRSANSASARRRSRCRSRPTARSGSPASAPAGAGRCAGQTASRCANRATAARSRTASRCCCCDRRTTSCSSSRRRACCAAACSPPARRCPAATCSPTTRRTCTARPRSWRRRRATARSRCRCATSTPRRRCS
ncbi:MAG: RNA polymerase sigma factor [Planctomycetota bacterium]